ncbi:hypothetical protein [Nucisporomicrobium flavum]|uniref:hypothetical protein n=1 Tax=Nucisporomicrobium flavum TaxID=2785915 RepID=UPI0018F7B130|nr:hypothetical protein [Nucisporomicrobium flavum]
MANDALEDGLEPLSETQLRSGAAFDRVIGNMANSAVTAFVAAGTGSPEAGAALGGAVGPLAEELSYAIRRIVDVRRERATVMVSAAADENGVSSSELLDQLLRDPAKMRLLVVGIEAAGEATADAKLKLISEIVATGALAEDEAVVDEQLLALSAIRELEVPHFRLMLQIALPSPVYWATAQERQQYRYAWPESRIVEASPTLKNALPALAAKLQSLGLARTVAVEGAQDVVWRLTSFGETCVDAIKDQSRFS